MNFAVVMIPISDNNEEQGHSRSWFDLLAISVIGEFSARGGRDVSQTTDGRWKAGSYVGRKGSEGNDAIDRQTFVWSPLSE